MPARIASAGDVMRIAAPLTRIVPESAGVSPNSVRASSVRPLPTRPAMPRISPRRDRQRHVANPGRGAGQPLHGEHRRPDVDRGLGEDGGDVAADHQPNQLARLDAGGGPGVDAEAVAKDGDAIGHREDLLEPVRNVDHADLGLTQASNHLEQPVHLAAGQRGGRLVHDDDPRIGPDRLGDLDNLLLRHAERLDHPQRVDGRSDPGQQRRRVVSPPPPVDAPPHPAALECERHVLGHGEVREERGLLVDGGDAEPVRGRRVHARHLAAGHAERARVGTLGAGDDADQRGLPRPVLADQRVDLARPEIERHAFEGLHPRVGLGDVRGLEQHGGQDSGAPRAQREGGVKSQAPSSKSQPLPTSNSQLASDWELIGNWELGVKLEVGGWEWLGFGIWNLGFDEPPADSPLLQRRKKGV